MNNRNRLHFTSMPAKRKESKEKKSAQAGSGVGGSSVALSFEQRKERRRERYFKAIEMSGKREPFSSLGRIVYPPYLTSDDIISKELYEKIVIIIEKQDPDELAVLCAVNKTQLELRKLDPIPHIHEEWGLWDLCVVLETQLEQDTELWGTGMNEMTNMVKHWNNSYYDVNISPLFYIVQRSCDDDSDEDESIEAAPYFAGCIHQAQLWKRIYEKHILLEHGKEEEEKEEHYWAVQHKVKKHLHALKNIVGM